MKKRNYSIFLIGFMAIALVLYGLILTGSGALLICWEYASIVLCFLFALISFRSPMIIAGLSLTLCADFCLVICDPIEQLWGMIFFLAAQSCYATKLHRQGLHKGFLLARLGLSVVSIAVCVLVLGQNADLLAVVSICYYANLIMNLICAFARFRDNRLLAIGLVLFLLCDTVIGLQVAAGGYLSIPEGSWIYQIIFSGFHLSWFFYLPSQVLIALSGRRA